MTLLSILVGLGLEYFLGTLDRIRNFVWFEKYCGWLELRCNRLSFWDGPIGVLITTKWFCNEQPVDNSENTENSRSDCRIPEDN